MKFVGYLLLFILCESLITEQCQSTKGPEVKERMQEGSMYVISHLSNDNCFPDDKNDRPTLTDEADPTYAELAKLSLPASFTICSMVMLSHCTKSAQFFALLDEDGEDFISALLHQSWTAFRLNVKGNPYIRVFLKNTFSK